MSKPAYASDASNARDFGPREIFSSRISFCSDPEAPPLSLMYDETSLHEEPCKNYQQGGDKVLTQFESGGNLYVTPDSVFWTSAGLITGPGSGIIGRETCRRLDCLTCSNVLSSFSPIPSTIASSLYVEARHGETGSSTMTGHRLKLGPLGFACIRKSLAVKP